MIDEPISTEEETTISPVLAEYISLLERYYKKEEPQNEALADSLDILWDKLSTEEKNIASNLEIELDAGDAENNIENALVPQVKIYVCQNCGTPTNEPRLQCSVCYVCFSIAERAPQPTIPVPANFILGERSVEPKRKRKPVEPSRPVPLTSLSNENLDRVRFPSGIDSLLGNGAVRGSSIIIHGEPGIGKSTVILQTAGELAKRGEKCLYVSAEESAYQVAERARRVNASQAKLFIVFEHILMRVIAAIERVRPTLVIIDSINRLVPTDFDRPGGMVEINRCSHDLVRAAAKNNAVLIFVAHVTKGGDLSGPEQFNHLVDTVIEFRGDPASPDRIMQCSKNRFCATTMAAHYMMGQNGLMLVEVGDSSDEIYQQKPKKKGRFLWRLESVVKPKRTQIFCII